MQKKYSQTRAMLAISRASLRSILRSPSAVLFSIFFPLTFILVFGFIGGSGTSVRVGLQNISDTGNSIIRSVLKSPIIKLVTNKDSTGLRGDLEKGRLAAILSVDSVQSPDGTMHYRINSLSSSASMDKYPILRSSIAMSIQQLEESRLSEAQKFISLRELPPISGRKYTMIDFILPGMLGFSLLSAGLFGVAFLFFNLRQQLVLKRFFATPVSRPYIVLGEGISRILFQMLTAVIIITIGHFFFDFTLVHGWVTFAEMLLLSFMALVVFMGFGFIVSSVSKNESSIPPFANVITLPQFLLGGTFFSTDVFPDWLQKICEILPLKQLNDAMRNVAFEGAHLADCGKQIGILALWGILVYAVTVKVFRWE